MKVKNCVPIGKVNNCNHHHTDPYFCTLCEAPEHTQNIDFLELLYYDKTFVPGKLKVLQTMDDPGKCSSQENANMTIDDVDVDDKTTTVEQENKNVAETNDIMMTIQNLQHLGIDEGIQTEQNVDAKMTQTVEVSMSTCSKYTQTDGSTDSEDVVYPCTKTINPDSTDLRLVVYPHTKTINPNSTDLRLAVYPHTEGTCEIYRPIVFQQTEGKCETRRTPTTYLHTEGECETCSMPRKYRKTSKMMDT